MTVLVTGADGFIGSHLVERLVKDGHRVRALVQYNSFNNWGWLEGSSCLSDVEVITGDVRDANVCRDLCDQIDTVYHLAALIAIPYSYRAPSSYVDTNVQGTLNMCQAAKDCSVSRFIQTSTSEVYGTAQYVPIDEQHPLQPQSPYSASKIAADAMAMSYHNAFELPVTVARPFNTYGPRQSARAVIPSIIGQIAAGQKRIELGDVSPTRDFNYVADTCQGFIELAKSDKAIGETVNICTGKEISIEDTLLMIKEIMKSDVDLVCDEARLRPKGSEVFRLLGCPNKLQSMTDFSSKMSLREGLSETIRWFTDPDNLRHYKTNIYNV